jgi:hypothetical protein
MKKFLLSLFLFSFVLFYSCEEPEPPRPACEVNQTGTIQIINHTGFQIKVDVWDGSFIGERYVSNGSSTTYSNVDAGTVEIWESDPYAEWGYWTRYLDSCETLEFEITSKKAGGTLILNSADKLDKIK